LKILLQSVSHLLLLTNSSINFLIYCAVVSQIGLIYSAPENLRVCLCCVRDALPEGRTVRIVTIEFELVYLLRPEEPRFPVSLYLVFI
jgi:hypothetical protein